MWKINTKLNLSSKNVTLSQRIKFCEDDMKRAHDKKKCENCHFDAESGSALKTHRLLLLKVLQRKEKGE